MSKTLTFELPEEIYEALQEIAAKSGRPTEALVLEWLARYAPRPLPPLIDEELRAEWQRLRRHEGAANSGDPFSANNERIDADLEREYDDTHDERS